MRVVLTHKQFQAARFYATERHRLYFDRAEVIDKQRGVDMPPAGWKALINILEDAAFTRAGRGKPVADVEALGARSALTTITRALTTLQVHPAMRSEVVVGFAAQQFLVWSSDNGMGRHWQPWPHSLFPQPILLEPAYEADQIIEVGRRRMRLPEGITYWRTTKYPGDISEHEGWLLDQDEAALTGEDEVGLEHQSQ